MSYTARMVTTHSPEETMALARTFLAKLGEVERTRGTSTIVALSGDLGAGKTVFVQGLARALGIEERVVSPTFVIQKIYRLPQDASWKHLVHIDAYRLSGEEELETIGWYETATAPHNLVVIEWPEQAGLAIPERAYPVVFNEEDEATRKIELPLV